MKIDNLHKDKWTVVEKIENDKMEVELRANNISKRILILLVGRELNVVPGISDRFTVLSSYFPILQ